MKLLRIALSLLLLLSPIACASVQEITPDAISNTKYGMEFREVQKTLGAQGDLVLKWAMDGKHYFINRYYLGKSENYIIYYMLFKDDIYIAAKPENLFYKIFEKRVVPVGKLPFEDGFESLYAELVAQKDEFYQIDFHKVDFRARFQRELGARFQRELEKTKQAEPEKTRIEQEQAKDAELEKTRLEREKTTWDLNDWGTSIIYNSTSPIWVPLLVPFLGIWKGLEITYEKKEEKFQNKFDKLSIGTSKETVIELLGQPELIRKSIKSDYEILFYGPHSVIGLRGGKVEWSFNNWMYL